jgi:hypothetical protein
MTRSRRAAQNSGAPWIASLIEAPQHPRHAFFAATSLPRILFRLDELLNLPLSQVLAGAQLSIRPAARCDCSLFAGWGYDSQCWFGHLNQATHNETVRIIALWQQLGFFDYGQYWFLVAVTVAFALVGIVTFGSLAGSMLPFILSRLGFDPASASAPFIATLVDVTGLVIYFGVAAFILRGTLL